jgi:hypothetical protein
MHQFGVHEGKRRGTISSDAEAIFRKADKEPNDLRRQEQEARNDPSLSRKQRTDLIAIIREDMHQMQNEGRKTYRQIKEQAPAF